MSRTDAGGRGLCVVLAIWLVGSTALAQTELPLSRDSKLHAGISLLVLGSSSTAGSTDAVLTRPSGGTLTLFSVDSKIAPSLGVEMSLTRELGARFAVEAGGSWTMSEIRAEIHDDLEGAAPAVATDRFQRVTIEGSVLWGFAQPGSVTWYLRAGGGWFRDLAGRAAVSSDGNVGNLALGMKYWWYVNPGRTVGRVGIRVEGRASTQIRGQALGPREARIAPALTAGVLLGF